MSYRKAFYLVCATVLCLAACLVAQQKKNPGYTDTAILPGQKWHVHDSGDHAGRDALCAAFRRDGTF